MLKRRVAVSGLLFTAVAFAGACSDVPPTEPLALDQDISLFRGASQDRQTFTANLDQAFVHIAEQHPGFGGYFYGADGTLNIYMSGAATMSATLGSSLAGLGVDLTAQPVNVLEAQYDFIQLNAMHRIVTPVLGLQGTVFTDADEARNRVVVGVEDAAAAAAVERVVAMLGLPAGAVIIEITHPIEMETNHTLRDMVRPVAGGLQINFTRGDPPSGFLCTLGFNVRSPAAPNVHGFVTNSHCSDTRGEVVPTPYWQHSRFVEGTFIGWEEHDIAGFPCVDLGGNPRVCRYSDALGARYAAGVENAFGAIYRTVELGSLEIDPANPRFTIVAELPFPTVGMVLHKVGRTSGWTMGTVTATCVNSNVAGSDWRMLCQDRVATVSAGGDSGAPYFVRIGETDNVALIGIHWGSGGGTTVLSSMNNIRCENEGPAPWITFPGQSPPVGPPCTRPTL